MIIRKASLILTILYFSLSVANAQYEIRPEKGYTPQIGLMVDMLEDIKDRITAQIIDLDQESTDFLFDEKANSIGAIIMHLVATEAYYQVETLEARSFSEDESEFWRLGLGLGPESREQLKGKPIQHYLELWDQVRSKTLEGLKTKDDQWFASNIDENMNYHWAWYHILEHQANHMGQIALIKSRIPQ